MKSIIKIALSILVALSFFSLQSCKKEETKITPVQTQAPAPVNKTIIGKWRAIKGTRTTIFEFIKGIDDNHGSGKIETTTLNPGNNVTVSTIPIKWIIFGINLEIMNDFDNVFTFQLSDDGSRLIIFSDSNRKDIYATCERIK